MIQIIIIILYLLLTFAVGIFSTRRKKKKESSDSFHGAELGLLMCIAVGAGEWLGGTSTTGVSEYGYAYGLSGAWYTIANAIGIVVLALFFTKLYRKIKMKTVPGILDHYVGGRTKIVSSIMQIFILIVVGMSQLIAIGSIGETLLNINATLAISVFGIIVLVYTVLGGMKAVGKTNILHMVIMYVGSITLIAVLLKEIGGYSSLKQNLDSSYFSMVSIGWPKISSWIIASVLGACVAQAGLQPILVAKDDKTALRSSYIIALVVAPFGFLSALLGIIAKYKFPDLVNAKLALPTLLMSVNPYIGGIMIASIFAAILSTASPIFLSCGTLFTHDILPEKVQDTEKKKMLYSKLSITVAGIICIVLSIAFYNLKKVLDIVYFAYSLRGSMFIILLLGIYWKKVEPHVANIAMGLTLLVGLFWVVFKQITGSFPISKYFSDTYATVLVALIVTFFGSLIVNKIKAKQQPKIDEESSE